MFGKAIFCICVLVRWYIITIELAIDILSTDLEIDIEYLDSG